MPNIEILIPVLIVAVYLLSSIKILAEYERGVVFRLGRVLSQPKGPGVILVFAPIDRMVRISLRIEAMEVPAQDIITATRAKRPKEEERPTEASRHRLTQYKKLVLRLLNC